ncbi:MAG: translation initiation factor IF-2 [Aureispira sp.]|nr:translation initiation factor IF-2 [Aureispira sp.]
MSKRLVKVAKELNVGTKTIVEFLNGKGFEVSNKPTAKLSVEMYDMLVKNFQKSIAIKEQANQITIGTRKKEEKPEDKLKPWERPSLAHKEPKSLKEETPVEEVSKKEEPETNKNTEQQEEQVKERETPQLKGPKILGKIDLAEQDNKRKKRGQNKKTTPPKKEEEVKATDTENKKKVEEKKEPVVQETKETKETPVVENVESEKVKEVVEEKTTKSEGKNKRTEQASDDENRNVQAPQLKGLKILGKINIESSKKKRGKKKKGEQSQGKDNKSENKGKQQKQGGDNKNTKPSDDANKKRKRKRTKISKGTTGSSNNSNNQNQNQNQSKTSNSGGSSNNNNNNNRNSNNRNNSSSDRGKGKKRRKKKEISDKEVSEKLKETMARVQGGGKKRRKFGSTRSERDEKKERQSQEDAVVEIKKIQVTEFVSVSELAGLMEINATDVIMACMRLGVIVSINQRLDAEVIELVASEFDYEVEFISAEDQVDTAEEEEADDPADLVPRSPIVTVMGHVDHGKTSLLDQIRKANVMGGEAGGITQHIGAYEVKVGDAGKVTFLDTPGHEAFTAMRARGAKVTDIAVIIIAADDNVMPQTKEAISHAQAADVPIIFAINKIDKEGASPDKIKQELSGMNLLVEEWGGKYQSQDISAKQNLNLDLLLEKILLEAEMLELKANPKRRALGTVLEASLEKGKGYVTKILVQNGTLSVGDTMLAGQFHGKVKAMFNERGKRIKKAGPSTPVLVLGLQGAPQAGERLKVMPSEREAKDLANKRAQIVRQQQIRATRRITLDDITRRLKVGNFQELNLIVKGDMDGSVEALSDSLLKLSTEKIQTNIIYKAVGSITESDVNLAAASDAIIIGFQVRPNPMAKKLAELETIEIKTYSVIYDAIDEIKAALEGMLEPVDEEREVGQVEVQQVFKISKVGTVAGCLVQEGKITRNSFIRVIRDNIVMYPKKEGVNGELTSLKRYKDNINEVKNGMECGLTVKGFNDLRVGDMIEVYEIVQVKQTLND